MLSKRVMRAFAVGAVLISATVGLSACGKKGDNANAGSDVNVGLVTDIGGLNDRSFNFLANEGFKKAKDDLGVGGSVIESRAAGDYESNLGQMVKKKDDLVIGIGFLMGDAIKNAAKKAPDTNFAIVDFTYDDPKSGWTATKNVAGIQFKEQEAGYLAGVIAGAAEQEGTLKGLNPKHVVSAVGGQQIPPVDKYIAGFKAGVMSQCKDCTVLVDYSQDFIDQSKCQDRADKQITQGSDIVFQVAGQCGLGALSSAKAKGIWGIGVDADQAYLGDHILTSAMKRVDTSVYEMIKLEKDGDFPGGTTTEFGLKQDGVGLGKVAAPAQKYQQLADDAAEKIKNGDLNVPASI